ncbi:MAG: 3-isopropylmalate dehydratase [Deltaproteobacteria bacterium]|nr:3-isopropylmalate dehydratase [Deltaproteobacteria bacterium]MBW2129937.1 3-isopropylmalate dehydratase [Deltaproteobacteria bacterium]
MEKINGRVRKFGDNIDTDTITPGSILHLPIEEIRDHTFEPIFPGFSRTVKAGDVIVAGNNFGCGSSREQATAVLKELGIRYVLCESMARIYFRNCIALGLYPIMAPGVSAIFSEGDEIEIDLEGGGLKNLGTRKTLRFKPLSGMTREIVEGGGILPVLKSLTEKNNT